VHSIELRWTTRNDANHRQQKAELSVVFLLSECICLVIFFYPTLCTNQLNIPEHVIIFSESLISTLTDIDERPFLAN